jgi:ribosomal protein S2
MGEKQKMTSQSQTQETHGITKKQYINRTKNKQKLERYNTGYDQHTNP